MDNIKEKLLKQLIQNRIIDENSASQVLKQLETTKDTLGDILIQNNYFSKEDMLLLVVEFYKKDYLSLEEINSNFAINSEIFLQELAKNLNLKYLDLDST